MKKILLIIALLICLAPVAQAQMPTYTNGQYYAWVSTNAVTASNALAFVNTSGWFPITGRNAKTGELQPDKEKTMKWANEVQVTTNLLYCFPRIPSKTLKYVGVPMTSQVWFVTNFWPTVMAKEDIVFPPEEEE